MMKTEIVYLARVDRKKQSELTYLNNLNFLNMQNEINKFYYVTTLGHLNHLKNIYKFKDVGFINFNESWFLIPKGKKLMNKREKIFLKKLSSSKIEIDNKNYLNNYEDYINNKILGLGWFYNKIDNQLYSDGSTSFLILNQSENFHNKTIELNLKNAFPKENDNNKIEIFINNEKINTQIFDKKIIKKKISLNLTNFRTNEIIIEFKFDNTMSLFDLKKGIDQKKRSVILSDYKIINN